MMNLPCVHNNDIAVRLVMAAQTLSFWFQQTLLLRFYKQSPNC